MLRVGWAGIWPLLWLPHSFSNVKQVTSKIDFFTRIQAYLKFDLWSFKVKLLSYNLLWPLIKVVSQTKQFQDINNGYKCNISLMGGKQGSSNLESLMITIMRECLPQTKPQGIMEILAHMTAHGGGAKPLGTVGCTKVRPTRLRTNKWPPNKCYPCFKFSLFFF